MVPRSCMHHYTHKKITELIPKQFQFGNSSTQITEYIYIYMAVTSISGHKNGQNLKKSQFYSQKWPTKTATKSWRFLLCFWFLLLNFLIFFSLFLLVSCRFMTCWHPKTAHQMRLQAIWLYIFPKQFGQEFGNPLLTLLTKTR